MKKGKNCVVQKLNLCFVHTILFMLNCVVYSLATQHHHNITVLPWYYCDLCMSWNLKHQIKGKATERLRWKWIDAWKQRNVSSNWSSVRREKSFFFLKTLRGIDEFVARMRNNNKFILKSIFFMLQNLCRIIHVWNFVIKLKILLLLYQIWVIGTVKISMDYWLSTCIITTSFKCNAFNVQHKNMMDEWCLTKIISLANSSNDKPASK